MRLHVNCLTYWYLNKTLLNNLLIHFLNRETVTQMLSMLHIRCILITLDMSATSDVIVQLVFTQANATKHRLTVQNSFRTIRGYIQVKRLTLSAI